jgi:thiamine-monophosphate kinase
LHHPELSQVIAGSLMPSEFSLIERYFAQPAAALHASTPPGKEPKATLGIGDDCALLAPRRGMQLAISTDMLVSGRHFFPDVSPWNLGYKALAVNLSDLAAMGAKPRAFTLGLSMPDANDQWLESFSEGLFHIARQFDCELIGGDTTSGPHVSICITVFGDVPKARALRRDSARPGDDIWISGTLGNARAGLGILRGEWSMDTEDAERAMIQSLEQPEPRVALGIALRGVAHAALDISDGLAGDLVHILKRSKVRASVNIDLVPRSETVAAMPADMQLQCVLAGGDDYELCFTAPAEARPKIERIAKRLKVPLTCIGTIHNLAAPGDTPAIDWRGNTGPVLFRDKGFDHFHAD